jgi:hypothetical protein
VGATFGTPRSVTQVKKKDVLGLRTTEKTLFFNYEPSPTPADSSAATPQGFLSYTPRGTVGSSQQNSIQTAPAQTPPAYTPQDITAATAQAAASPSPDSQPGGAKLVVTAVLGGVAGYVAAASAKRAWDMANGSKSTASKEGS